MEDAEMNVSTRKLKNCGSLSRRNLILVNSDSLGRDPFLNEDRPYGWISTTET